MVIVLTSTQIIYLKIEEIVSKLGAMSERGGGQTRIHFVSIIENTISSIWSYRINCNKMLVQTSNNVDGASKADGRTSRTVKWQIFQTIPRLSKQTVAFY